MKKLMLYNSFLNEPSDIKSFGIIDLLNLKSLAVVIRMKLFKGLIIEFDKVFIRRSIK